MNGAHMYINWNILFYNVKCFKRFKHMHLLLKVNFTLTTKTIAILLHKIAKWDVLKAPTKWFCGNVPGPERMTGRRLNLHMSKERRFITQFKMFVKSKRPGFCNISYLCRVVNWTVCIWMYFCRVRLVRCLWMCAVK